MSGYIIHFDNETELAHYGVKGMKWRKHKRPKTPQELRKEEIDNTPGLDKNTKMLRKAAVDYNYEEDKKAFKKYGLVRENPNDIYSSHRFVSKHKSAKKPLQTKKYRRGQENLATLRGERVEKQLTKNLDSGKKMNKTYKMGPGNAKIYFKQDSRGTLSYAGYGRNRKLANKIINKSYNNHINNVESKRPINRGKKLIKKWISKLF